jgi:hypothetical protein
MGWKPSPLSQDWDYLKETRAWLEEQDELEREQREQDEQERSRYVVAPVRFPAQTSRRQA